MPVTLTRTQRNHRPEPVVSLGSGQGNRHLTVRSLIQMIRTIVLQKEGVPYPTLAGECLSDVFYLYSIYLSFMLLYSVEREPHTSPRPRAKLC